MLMIPAHVKKANIHIGGVYSSKEPAVVRTVLGSCVAACVFDHIAEIGGMNHFMLPNGTNDSGLPTRFGVNAMEVLINGILQLGGERARLQAKIFGAAHVLHMPGRAINVPDKNAHFIAEFLETEQIPIISRRLGGPDPLLVYFFTHSAKALIKALKRHDVASLVEEEARHQVQLSQDITVQKVDDITLF